jgi:hypothetical protein
MQLEQPKRGLEVPSGMTRKLNRAIDICRVIKDLGKRLEDLKQQVRDYAAPIHSVTHEKVELLTGKGITMITFPEPSLSIRKGAAPAALKDLLGIGVWNGLFQTKVVIAPTFQVMFDALPREHQQLITQYVVQEDETPRVTFPK